MRTWGLVGLALGAVACGGGEITNDAGARADASDGGDGGAATSAATVRFELPESGLPRPLAVPWPTDLYLDGDGTIVDDLDDWSETRAGRSASAFRVYGALDGFGVLGGAVFVVEGDAIDPSTLPRDRASCAADRASVALVDVDADASSPGARVRCEAGFAQSHGTIAVWPAAPLEPAHTYAALVTTDVRSASGEPVRASAAFAAIREDAPGAREGAAGALYGAAIDRVVDLTGIDRERIAGLTVFTTQSLPPRLRDLREQLFEELPEPPALNTASTLVPMRRFGAEEHAGWTATLGAWLGVPLASPSGEHVSGFPGDGPEAGVPHDAIGAVLMATFTSPRWTRDYARTRRADDGTIAYDASGHASVVDPAAEVPVMIVLPRAAPPASGWPVVIFQHGGGLQRGWAAAIANELARAGIATVAIDAPWHGMRVEGAVDERPFYGTGGTGTYDGPDGLADSADAESFLSMVGFTNFLAGRDNFVQATLDLVQLRRLIGNPALDLSPVADAWPGAEPRFDATRVGYVGMSMGGFLGTALATCEPRASINPLVLDVAAAGFVRALPDSPAMQVQWPLLAILAGLARDAAVHPAAPYPQIGQGLFDPMDPGVLAPGAAAGPDGEGHDLWFLAALHDEAAPRSASDDLARALGAVQITPTVREVEGLTRAASPLGPDPTTGRVVGYFEVAPGHHAHLLLRSVLSRRVGEMNGGSPREPSCGRAEPRASVPRARGQRGRGGPRSRLSGAAAARRTVRRGERAHVRFAGAAIAADAAGYPSNISICSRESPASSPSFRRRTGLL